MFTGIVEELGEVRVAPEGTPARLVVAATTTLGDATVGASVAVNGVCLTVVDHDDATVTFDVAPETLARSSLGGLRVGD
ncbi:MAG TPA: riboflavin synthase, partial [Acidimicrobiia bacterium]|nr:riboflavin synthase [Acidimicrobiia bacterium]